MYRVATEFLLGVQPRVDGIRIAPCIPNEWQSYSITRQIAGADYTFNFANPDGKSGQSVEITVNGSKLDSNLIPYAKAGEKVTVQVMLK